MFLKTKQKNQRVCTVKQNKKQKKQNKRESPYCTLL